MNLLREIHFKEQLAHSEISGSRGQCQDPIKGQVMHEHVTRHKAH